MFLRNKEDRTPVPLRGIKIEADVQNSVVELKMHQFYENVEDKPIETEFYFPVDPRYAVTGITIKYSTG